jgi:hypothetical protein
MLSQTSIGGCVEGKKKIDKERKNDCLPVNSITP